VKGTVPIKAGSYEITPTAWFDVRMCDGGLALSLCDLDMNIRYTAVIDDGKVVFKEIGKLVRDESLPTGTVEGNIEHPDRPMENGAADVGFPPPGPDEPGGPELA
jgi:hypothetical protein